LHKRAGGGAPALFALRTAKRRSPTVLKTAPKGELTALHSYRYDAMDRVITTTYPTNEVVTQTYNIAAPRSVAQVRSATHNVA